MKPLIAIAIMAEMLGIALLSNSGEVKWINEAKKSKCTNPFFTKGFTVYLDGNAYEIGFREDGSMVWRHP